VAFTAGRRYFWTLSTSKGAMRLQPDPAAAPMHVTSTIYLTLLGFYDGLTFHRIVKGWVAQGGDPLGTGTGDPGYGYAVETSPTAKHAPSTRPPSPSSERVFVRRRVRRGSRRAGSRGWPR
jgi:cyclophilin family peptidyl-prolyl cis-trans isomerase